MLCIRLHAFQHLLVKAQNKLFFCVQPLSSEVEELLRNEELAFQGQPNLECICASCALLVVLSVMHFMHVFHALLSRASCGT